ncbi:hypothetical protein Cgig2_021866 [Carnegiea gigantea]|uniref:CBM20 domain-containing protein n=1 Tax=Carnegiea gigantea TaxID=171969 RepID=A0A9Q1GQP0_9CARY|nr:hypothetical protein Cgig2_021866 [Carnegiea gigantea]
MGTGSSKNSDSSSHGGEDREDQAGGQLYVSLKIENYKLRGDLVPHVFGSAPIVGSWNSAKALSMERESTSMWELSFVVPPNHETLDFKFLLRPKDTNVPCVVEEGPNRILSGGRLREGARAAVFRFKADDIVEYKVCIKADRVSPFDVAASWRAYRENLQPSAVRGIPDVSISSVPETSMENGPSASLELDLEQYVIPSPAISANSGLVYPANLGENPRSLVSSRSISGTIPEFSRSVGTCIDRPAATEEMEAAIRDPSKFSASSAAGETKSVAILPPLQGQESHKGTFVDRGVGSPRIVKSPGAGAFATNLKLGSESKNAMPAAAGAVAAAAVADQMLRPKEDRHLAIVLVGLPARGKTFTAVKLTRYLRWLGHETKHFNVGKVTDFHFYTSSVESDENKHPKTNDLCFCFLSEQYRRLKLGTNQSADFFRGDNPEGMEARNEVAALAMEDMISWMQEGGQVGIFDATNSTRERRNMLMKMAEGKCKVRGISMGHMNNLVLASGYVAYMISVMFLITHI